MAGRRNSSGASGRPLSFISDDYVAALALQLEDLNTNSSYDENGGVVDSDRRVALEAYRQHIHDAMASKATLQELEVEQSHEYDLFSTNSSIVMEATYLDSTLAGPSGTQPVRARPDPTAPALDSGVLNPNTTEFVCDSCGEQAALRDGTPIRLACDHAYCSECFQRMAANAAKNESSYPARCCRHAIPFDILFEVLSHDEFMQYVNADHEFSSAYRLYCANKTCSRFIPDEIAYFSGRFVRCTFCGKRTCQVCRELKHRGLCVQSEETKILRSMESANGWQRCARCGRTIELKDGCNHITCICGHQFCYVCGARYGTCDCQRAERVRMEQHGWGEDFDGAHSDWGDSPDPWLAGPHNTRRGPPGRRQGDNDGWGSTTRSTQVQDQNDDIGWGLPDGYALESQDYDVAWVQDGIERLGWGDSVDGQPRGQVTNRKDSNTRRHRRRKDAHDHDSESEYRRNHSRDLRQHYKDCHRDKRHRRKVREPSLGLYASERKRMGTEELPRLKHQGRTRHDRKRSQKSPRGQFRRRNGKSKAKESNTGAEGSSESSSSESSSSESSSSESSSSKLSSSGSGSSDSGNHRRDNENASNKRNIQNHDIKGNEHRSRKPKSGINNQWGQPESLARHTQFIRENNRYIGSYDGAGDIPNENNYPVPAGSPDPGNDWGLGKLTAGSANGGANGWDDPNNRVDNGSDERDNEWKAVEANGNNAEETQEQSKNRNNEGSRRVSDKWSNKDSGGSIRSQAEEPDKSPASNFDPVQHKQDADVAPGWRDDRSSRASQALSISSSLSQGHQNRRSHHSYAGDHRSVRSGQSHRSQHSQGSEPSQHSQRDQHSWTSQHRQHSRFGQQSQYSCHTDNHRHRHPHRHHHHHHHHSHDYHGQRSYEDSSRRSHSHSDTQPADLIVRILPYDDSE